MLESSLLSYNPASEHEDIDRVSMLAPLRSGQPCFDRNNPWAHFTGSALLLSYDLKKVLLNHHKFLNMWLQFGGHADGNPDLLDVARREVMEESGFTKISPVAEGIFDLSVHAVPENIARKESAHLHYDVRYLFRLDTAEDNFQISDESIDLRWCDYDQAIALTGDGSVKRMLDKWREYGF